MINMEVFRLELNYLKQVAKGILGDKVSGEIGEAIELLVLCFLNPKNYAPFAYLISKQLSSILSRFSKT
jgi:hypothetical protein